MILVKTVTVHDTFITLNGDSQEKIIYNFAAVTGDIMGININWVDWDEW